MTPATPVQPAVSADALAAADVTLVGCPLCHRPHQILHASDWWKCATCGASWDAHRLTVVAAYARFCLVHDATHRRGAAQ